MGSGDSGRGDQVRDQFRPIAVCEAQGYAYDALLRAAAGAET
ncbi:hypothetical protein [Streptomyces flaveolus]